jgi:hypothetical protein
MRLGTRTAKRTAAKRQLMNTGTNKRYGAPGQSGKFKELDVGRSLGQDRRKAKTKTKPGRDDKGDR